MDRQMSTGESIKYVCCSGARAASTAEQAEAPQECLEESAECPVRNDADEGSSQVRNAHYQHTFLHAHHKYTF